MNDEAPDMVEVLRSRVSKVQTNAEDRRARELRGVHHLDRRGIRTPPEHVRNVQLNLKVSAKFKQRLSALSVGKKISATEYIVRAVEAYAAQDKG